MSVIDQSCRAGSLPAGAISSARGLAVGLSFFLAACSTTGMRVENSNASPSEKPAQSTLTASADYNHTPFRLLVTPYQCRANSEGSPFFAPVSYSLEPVTPAFVSTNALFPWRMGFAGVSFSNTIAPVQHGFTAQYAPAVTEASPEYQRQSRLHDRTLALGRIATQSATWCCYLDDVLHGTPSHLSDGSSFNELLSPAVRSIKLEQRLATAQLPSGRLNRPALLRVVKQLSFPVSMKPSDARRQITMVSPATFSGAPPTAA